LTALACDLTKRRLGWPGFRRSSILTAPVRVIDEVEHFAPELQAVPFADLKSFEDAKIPVLETGPVDQIAISLTGERSSSRRSEKRRAIRIFGLEL